MGVGRVHAAGARVAAEPEARARGPGRRSRSCVQRRSARAASHATRDRSSSPRCDRAGASAARAVVDGDGRHPLGVLVQDQLARRDVGERRRVAGLVAAPAASARAGRRGAGRRRPAARGAASRIDVAEAVARRGRARAARRAPPAPVGARARASPRSRSGRRRRRAACRRPARPRPGRRCRDRGTWPTPAPGATASGRRRRPRRPRRVARRRPQQPVVGSDEDPALGAVRSATARRASSPSAPTVGSTTARCTPAGRNADRVAQHERARRARRGGGRRG